MRYSSVSWRGLGLLVFGLLGVFGRPASAQVSAEVWARDDGYSVSRSLDALETSRAALLDARAAIDAALIEVDSALVVVRSVLPDRDGAMIAEGEEAEGKPTLFPRVGRLLHAAWERLGTRIVEEIAQLELNLPLPAEELPPHEVGETALAEDVPDEPLPPETVPAIAPPEEEIGIEAAGFDEPPWWEDEAEADRYAHQIEEPAAQESEVVLPEPETSVEDEIEDPEASPALPTWAGDEMESRGAPTKDDDGRESDPGRFDSPAVPTLPREEEEDAPASEAPTWWDGVPGEPWDPCMPPLTAEVDPPLPEGESSGNQ